MTDLLPQMIGPFLTYLLALAAGGLAPTWNKNLDQPGIRAFIGFALMVLVMFSTQAMFKTTASQSLAAVVVLAALGGLRSVGRRFADGGSLVHPVFILPAAFAAVLALRGGRIDYLPLAWDEYSNWLTWARQFMQYGNVLDPRIQTGVPGYTPGWPLILALPNLVHGIFHEGRALAMFALLHMLFLGLVFDCLRAVLNNLNIPRLAAASVSWAAVMVMTTVEASWKLVPINLLIEEPQTYTFAAIALLAAASRDIPKINAAFHLGAVFALSYLIKGAALAFAPSLGLIWLGVMLNRRDRRFGKDDVPALCVLALSVLIPYLIWSNTGASPNYCYSNAVLAFKGAYNRIDDIPRTMDLLHRFSTETWTYLATYKVPLTLSAIAGIIIAGVASPATLWITFPLILFYAVYETSLFAYHLDCFSDYYFTNLNSIPRFTRMPLRVFHIFGLFAGAAALAAFFGKTEIARRITLPVAVAAFVLFGHQVHRMSASLNDVETRAGENPRLVGLINTVKMRIDEAVAAVRDRNVDPGPIIFIDQGAENFAPFLARYYANQRLDTASQSSWGEQPVNSGMVQISADEMQRELLGSRLIVPITLDGWMIDVLTPLVADPGCLSEAPPRWLTRGIGDAKFSCAADLKDFQ